MSTEASERTWTVAEAKAKLSEVLRLAEEEGPQRIGLRRPFVIVPEHVWREKSPPEMHMGRWLIENVPRGLNWELPRERRSNRANPYADEVER